MAQRTSPGCGKHAHFLEEEAGREESDEGGKEAEEGQELLCKLEMLVAPGFINPMQHMLMHLTWEVLQGGTVQIHW
jgi:hypothetical protein